MARLDESTLDAVCELFAVRREWLDGAEKQVHPCRDFYKDPQAFQSFIEELKAKTPDGYLRGNLLVPEKPIGQAPALLILYEIIGYIGDNPIYRYHLCNNWNFRYWKSRAYLTACVAMAWKQKAYILGEYVPQKLIEQLYDGEALLGWKGEGIPRGRRWYPEDMALKPDEYLKGIDPERDNYGIRAGLAQWLDLEEEGWMATGLQKSVRSSFEQALKSQGN